MVKQRQAQVNAHGNIHIHGRAQSVPKIPFHAQAKRPANPARYAAYLILTEYDKHGTYIRDLTRSQKAQEIFAKADAQHPSDKAFALRLAHGVLACKGVLYEHICTHTKQQKSIEPMLMRILALAAFELLYLHTKPYSSLFEAVNLTKHVRPAAAGLVNAVLRRLQAEIEEFATAQRALHTAASDAYEVLQKQDRQMHEPLTSTTIQLASGLPLWLIEAFNTAGSFPSEAELLMYYDKLLLAAQTHISYNPQLLTQKQAYELLEDADTLPTWNEQAACFCLKKPAPLFTLAAVKEQVLIPADAASSLVVQKLALRGTEQILEIGQGRGTKTMLLIGALLKAHMKSSQDAIESDKTIANTGDSNNAAGDPTTASDLLAHIDAIELSERKAKMCERRLVTAGFEHYVRTFVHDATDLNKILKQLKTSYDLVFIDAPCSGTGTFRRHVERAWALSPADIAALRDIQLAMLIQAAPLVGIAQRLAYVTCSVLQAENEAVIAEFLGSSVGADFRLCSQELVSLPDSDKEFIALLERTNA